MKLGFSTNKAPLSLTLLQVGSAPESSPRKQIPKLVRSTPYLSLAVGFHELPLNLSLEINLLICCRLTFDANNDSNTSFTWLFRPCWNYFSKFPFWNKL